MNTIENVDVLSNKMKDNMIANATNKPWGWEWKFLTALFLLNEKRRSIKFVKDTLKVTYRDLLRWNLITVDKSLKYRVITHETF